MIKKVETDDTVTIAMAELINDIVETRKKQSISQSELAQLAGVKQSAVSRMESLKAMPQLDTLLRLIEPLGLKLTVKQKNQYKEYNRMQLDQYGVEIFEIDTTSCHLTLSMTEDDHFHIKTVAEDDFIFEKRGNKLVFEQKKRNILKWLFSWVPVEVKIEIPMGFRGALQLSNGNGRTHIYNAAFQNMRLENGNGALTCDDLSAASLSLTNGNGRIIMTNVHATDIDARSSNGRVVLIDTRAQGEIKARTSNGRLILKNCYSKDMRLKSSNGAILLSETESNLTILSTSNGKIVAAMPGNEADYALDLGTSNGSIYIGDNKHRGSYIVKGPDKKVEASTSNGSIRMSFSDTVFASSEEDSLEDIISLSIEEATLEQEPLLEDDQS